MSDDGSVSYRDVFAALGGRIEGGVVVSFGDVEGETRRALAAADSGATLTPLLAANVLRVTGPDARDFLHGQLAADIRSLGASGQVLSLLLNHKGHALADVAVLRVGPDYLLVVDDGKAELVAGSLLEHIVFDDVTVSGADALVITLQGADSETALAAAGLAVPDTAAVAGWEAGGVVVHCVRRRRSAAGGFDLVVAEATGTSGAASAAALAEGAQRVVERLLTAGAAPIGEPALAAARVDAMVPAAAFEGGDGVLPQEAGMVERLSYRKGCYLGQEIMARIEARGNLKRGLALLSVDRAAGTEGALSSGAPVMLADRAVGRVGTLVGMPGGEAAALVVLRRDVPEGAELAVSGAPARLAKWLPL